MGSYQSFNQAPLPFSSGLQSNLPSPYHYNGTTNPATEESFPLSDYSPIVAKNTLPYDSFSSNATPVQNPILASSIIQKTSKKTTPLKEANPLQNLQNPWVIGGSIVTAAVLGLVGARLFKIHQAGNLTSTQKLLGKIETPELKACYQQELKELESFWQCLNNFNKSAKKGALTEEKLIEEYRKINKSKFIESTLEVMTESKGKFDNWTIKNYQLRQKEALEQSMKGVLGLQKATTQTDYLKGLEKALSYIGANKDGSCAHISQKQLELLTGTSVNWHVKGQKSPGLLSMKELQELPSFKDDSIILKSNQEVLLFKNSEHLKECLDRQDTDPEALQKGVNEALQHFDIKPVGGHSSKFTTLADLRQHISTTLPENYVGYLSSKGHMQVLLKIKNKAFIVQNYSNGRGVGVHPLEDYVRDAAGNKSWKPSDKLPKEIDSFIVFEPNKTLHPAFYEKASF